MIKKNKTKTVISKCGKDKTIIPSNGRYEYIDINIFTFLIKKYLSKNVIDTYMKCGNVPNIWTLFFLNIAYNRYYVYNFCNRPVCEFDRLCREWCLYNTPDAYDIRVLNAELTNMCVYYIYMETTFDVSNFLNKKENAFLLTIEGEEDFERLETVLTNLFQDVNSEKLENVLENVRLIDVLI